MITVSTILDRRKSEHRVRMLKLDKIKLDARLYIPQQAAKRKPKGSSWFQVGAISVYAMNMQNAIRKYNYYLTNFGHQWNVNIPL